MPVAALYCPMCGTRVNKPISAGEWSRHVGDPDYAFGEVQCPRCKKPFQFDRGDIDSRTRDLLAELVAEDEGESVDDARFAEAVEDMGDSVEETLAAVEASFEEGSRLFESEDEVMEIRQMDVEQVVPPGKVEELSGVLAASMADKLRAKAGGRIPDRFVDAAQDYAQERMAGYMEDGMERFDEMTEQILRRNRNW